MDKSLVQFQMEILQRYVRLFEKLRRECGIPLKQPVLDYYYKGPILFPRSEWEESLAKAVNVWGIKEGWLIEKDAYYGFEVVRPDGSDWRFLAEDDMEVGINIFIPEWLAKIGEERKEFRKKVRENQKKEKLKENEPSS